MDILLRNDHLTFNIWCSQTSVCHLSAIISIYTDELYETQSACLRISQVIKAIRLLDPVLLCRLSYNCGLRTSSFQRRRYGRHNYTIIDRVIPDLVIDQ